MSKQRDLTEGSISKALITLAIPIIFTNLLQTAYQLIDAFWIGRLGSNAVAAVSISFPVIFFIMSLGMGVSIAGSILVAQFKGRKDVNAVNHISTQTLLFGIGFAFILGGIGFFISPIVLSLMHVPKEIFADALSYLRISFAGIVFIFGFMIFQSILRGIGEVKLPMIIVFGTVLLNLILDPIFIFGFGPIVPMGVGGAALVTVITQALACFIGLYLLIKGKFEIRLESLKPDFTLLKQLVKLGFPTSIEQSTRALGMVIIAGIVSSFGTRVLAAYGIGGRILSFTIIPAMGLSMATSTLTGQNIGAKKEKRVVETFKKSGLVSFIVLSLIGVTFYIFSREIALFFIPSDPLTVDMAATFIRYMSFGFGFMGIQLTINGIFRGSGNTHLSMLISLIGLWLFRIPLIYVLSHSFNLGEKGIWLAFPVGNILSAIVAIILLLGIGWKRTLRFYF